MIISYYWLKEYLQFDLSPQETADALTDIGIEAEGVEEIQSIKGGLEGLVIGQVLTCTRHPNSDHLHLTTVDIGDGAEPLHIICGAPNVAAGQKVVVAHHLRCTQRGGWTEGGGGAHRHQALRRR